MVVMFILHFLSPGNQHPRVHGRHLQEAPTDVEMVEGRDGSAIRDVQTI